MNHIITESDKNGINKSNEIILEQNLNDPLCLNILDEIFKIVSLGKNSIIKDNHIHNTRGRIYDNAGMSENNQLRGRNKATPTWLKFSQLQKRVRGLTKY